MISGLQFWEDKEARTPAEQMAVDEALLLRTGLPVVRFYRWASPAVTFGYAQKYAEVRGLAGARPLIRRWTGGGAVFHGEDLTITLAVPLDDVLSGMKTERIYRMIHEAILEAVRVVSPGARLSVPADCRPGSACFQSPALHDILHDGRKICGGALRRGRNGLLYQGSLHGDFSAASLGQCLSESAGIYEPDGDTLRLSTRLSLEKYGTQIWNQMR